MKKLLLPALLLVLASHSISQDKPAYILYNSHGKKISWEKMVRVLEKKDIIMFGEFHNNPISHWLELEVAKDMKEKRQIVMGAEMFERDNEEPLEKYLAGNLSTPGLDSSARLWKNYPTDYAPLVNFAKENHILFIATNIPRRYASLVSRRGFEGLDSLSETEKSWMAPLPIAYDPELPGYKKMLEMLPGHSSPNLPKAQAIKDATMAYFILKNYKPGDLFIHYNGSYHSENYEGIVWYLKKAKPDINIATITTVSQKDIHHLLKENESKADFIICVDEDMTTTY